MVMDSQKFRYARAKNFLCFGEEGVELNFEDYGPIVVVRGINKDTGTPEAPASNASGKSSLQDIIVYALYGKTAKELGHSAVINAAAGKKLEVEVQFGPYRVVRRRDPTDLRMWKSEDHLWDKETEITRGTMKDTQEMIEGIIGLNHQAFCSVVIFDDSRIYSFLEADTPSKRVIIENLLGLEQYRGYHDSAKLALKSRKVIVKELVDQYSKLQTEMKQCVDRIEKVEIQEKDWKKKKLAEASELMTRLKTKQEQLQSLDGGTEIEAYQKAQTRIEELRETIDSSKTNNAGYAPRLVEIREELETVKSKKTDLMTKAQAVKFTIQSTEANKTKSGKLIESLAKLDVGASCPVCHGTIDRSNYASVLAHEEHIVQDCNEKIAKENAVLEEIMANFKIVQAEVAALEEKEKQTVKKIKDLEYESKSNLEELNRLSKISKPDMDTKQQVLESEIENLRKQIKSKREELEGKSPYKEILEHALQEKSDKELENETKVAILKDAESEVPYDEFWVKGFGDTGIRKHVVEGIIPALNTRVAYWMQHLYDGNLELKFDNELEAAIKRRGTPVEYKAMSMGEKQRINLSVPHSFSYIQTLNCGTCPSLIFLDEVTGGGIDKVGVDGVFNMICELAKERQVFVTTHNEYLLNLLDGCEEITVVKENDVSRII